MSVLMVTRVAYLLYVYPCFLFFLFCLSVPFFVRLDRKWRSSYSMVCKTNASTYLSFSRSRGFNRRFIYINVHFWLVLFIKWFVSSLPCNDRSTNFRPFIFRFFCPLREILDEWYPLPPCRILFLFLTIIIWMFFFFSFFLRLPMEKKILRFTIIHWLDSK